MSVASRIAAYKARSFTDEQVNALVLMEQTAVILFKAFPNAFVLFGGATLVLLHESPRHSGDLDFHRIGPQFPKLEDIESVLGQQIAPIAEALKLAPIRLEREVEGNSFVRLWVIASSHQRLFSVDLSRIGSSLRQQVIEERLEASTLEESVTVPSKHLLLLQKAEALLKRSRVKARDAFDIAYLLGRGATLDGVLMQNLQDFIEWEEIEHDAIKKRVEGAIALIPVELKTYLPEATYARIEADNFEYIRKALSDVFAEWL